MKLTKKTLGVISTWIAVIFVSAAFGMWATESSAGEQIVGVGIALLISVVFGNIGKWLMNNPTEKTEEETQKPLKHN